MPHRLQMIVALVTVVGPAIAARHGEVRLRIAIVDYAANSPDVLNEVQRRGTILLNDAGIHSVWDVCSPTDRERANLKICLSDPTTVWIRIMPPQLARRLPLAHGSCGLALQDDSGGLSNMAVVDAGCAQRIARSKPAAWPTILAHIIVHEIGHLLLGAGSHGAEGLMRADWGRTEFDLMLNGLLNFAPSEAEVMRSALLQRASARFPEQALTSELVESRRMTAPATRSERATCSR